MKPVTYSAAFAAEHPGKVQEVAKIRLVKIASADRYSNVLLWPTSAPGMFDFVGVVNTPSMVWEREMEGNMSAGAFDGFGWSLEAILRQLTIRCA